RVLTAGITMGSGGATARSARRSGGSADVARVEGGGVGAVVGAEGFVVPAGVALEVDGGVLVAHEALGFFEGALGALEVAGAVAAPEIAELLDDGLLVVAPAAGEAVGRVGAVAEVLEGFDGGLVGGAEGLAEDFADAELAELEVVGAVDAASEDGEVREVLADAFGDLGGGRGVVDGEDE